MVTATGRELWLLKAHLAFAERSGCLHRALSSPERIQNDLKARLCKSPPAGQIPEKYPTKQILPGGVGGVYFDFFRKK